MKEKLACEGKSLKQIATTLSEEKVMIPSEYAIQNRPKDCHCRSYHDPYIWNTNTVGEILSRREYLGHTIFGKTIAKDFKKKKRRNATEEELIADDFYLNAEKEMKVISTSFVEGLMIRNELDLAESYRVEGVYSEKNNVVVFNFKNAERLCNEVEA